MAQKTKIKKDALGLYAIADGSIIRPFFGTVFNEGDAVSTHHFDGSTLAGVTIRDKTDTHNFKKNGIYEFWSTTMDSWHYKDKYFKPNEYEKLFGKSYSTFEEYLILLTNWYKETYNYRSRIYEEYNKNFIK